MKAKLLRWSLRIGIVCAVLALGGYLLRDSIRRQMRIYMLGLIEVKTEELGFFLPAVDEVEVIALNGDGFAGEEAPDRVRGYPILGRATVHSEEAEKIAEQWRRLPRGKTFSATCHHPGYALRFRQHGKELLVTTVCWGCDNHSIPLLGGNPTVGFDAKGSAGQALLALLQTHVPRP